uniref:Enhancing lycopene biosynthesis protein 2 n=1 Tax=Caligus clemensi TaxID=344056 RepID=C1C1F4_CALCM|nr:Enhancing lycopene biosynthesis protein 2 [Caligus clemensi]
MLGTNVAVLLSGCGHLDGSDPLEVSLLCLALSRLDIKPIFYAPYMSMSTGVNHVNGAEAETGRNVLIESARLVKESVLKLDELDPSDETLSALIIPGGHGPLNNFSDFKTSLETPPSVIKEILGIIEGFKAAGKPIGCTSHANILVALAIPNIEITLGSRDEEECPVASLVAPGLIEQGTTVTPTSVYEVQVDFENKIVTAAASLFASAKYHEVADQITIFFDMLMTLIEV